jgi:hypothetical protein
MSPHESKEPVVEAEKGRKAGREGGRKGGRER